MQIFNWLVKRNQKVSTTLSKNKLFLRKFFKLPIYCLAFIPVLIIRLIKPWLMVRLGALNTQRIGHFAANTELYLCERDVGINMPSQRHIDLFFMSKPICNPHLAIMWQRVLRIWPTWILASIDRINRFIPGGESHVIGKNTQSDRDVHNLLDRLPPHLQFTTEEEMRGEAGLRAIGLPVRAKFVCLIVRDSAYLDSYIPNDWNYHNYRDSEIQNYVLATEELAERGYFVIRMGVKVHAAINRKHPKVIDYATNGMRSDFMDVYLGAKCEFCISVGTGFDAVPNIFRRPIIYVNMVPIGYLNTFSENYIGIVKHHLDTESNIELTFSKILARNVEFCLHTNDYETKGVSLIENTPEEIRDVTVEMVERLNGTWQAHPEDESLQQRFWEVFQTNAVKDGKQLHGELRSRFGASFLRNNQWWLN